MADRHSSATLVVDNSTDEQVVASVISAETQAFIDDDFEAWSNCWAQDDRAKMVSVTPTTGVDVVSGWQAIATEMKHVMHNGLGCDMVEFRSSNMQIEIDGNSAWVVYDQWAKNRSGDSWECFETRILEKRDGLWRIMYCSFVAQDRDTTRDGLISVDKTGHVVWASVETFDRLKQHSFLTLSAGRVRAKRGPWDRILQDAIARAGRYHGFYELRRFEDETGGPFRCPVVLGETDEGGIASVEVSVRDSTTYLQIDGASALDRRLDVAQAVFGLSDGQTRVARHIAEGVGPKGAADALGITTNTARTHLTRLYEKTGVNSQAALVRVLLSVG